MKLLNIIIIISILFVVACTSPKETYLQEEIINTKEQREPEPVIEYNKENEKTQSENLNHSQSKTHERKEKKEPYIQPKQSFRKAPEIPSEAEKELLPACDGKEFTHFPVDLNKIYEISPIGNIAPPGHTFPTEHSFLHISPGGSTTETLPLSAPADVTVVHISEIRGITQDPVDYTIYFALCKDLIGYYNHVKELSGNLAGEYKSTECEDWSSKPDSSCAKNMFYNGKAGEVIGEVGRLQGNFDFGLIDLRKKHTFANEERYGIRSLYIQCPYEYYPIGMKNQFYELIERNDDRQCGTSAQDVPGTLQGNWFYGDGSANAAHNWDTHLAFIYDNENPQTAVISIAGKITDPQKWEFKPESSGSINRRFVDVRPGNEIYCYENIGERILLKLVSEKELHIELQKKKCSGYNTNYEFVKPVTYLR